MRFFISQVSSITIYKNVFVYNFGNMTFEEFCQDIEAQKQRMRNQAWFFLNAALIGKDISKIQMEAVKEVLDRTEGKAVQKQVISGEGNLPILIKVVKDEKDERENN